MNQIIRRKTPTVKIGNIKIGFGQPICIQSMTNTPTDNIPATLKQTVSLIKAGAEMVRWTINNEKSAQAVPVLIRTLRAKKFSTPIIGDFHYNGHLLLKKLPQCAKLLDKYRINPGNIGSGRTGVDNFTTIIKIAIANKKPVRIGVNYGSLDKELLANLFSKIQKSKNKKPQQEIIYDCMVKSALDNARLAEEIGLAKNKIVLSVKMSSVQDIVNVYERLAARCDYALHLGLTEAGSSTEGIISSASALAILLQKGIGDTIRISLTPDKTTPRIKEVEACKILLQSLGLRHFSPTIISCPGCGRTNSNFYQNLAEEIKIYVKNNLTRSWKRYKGIERLKIAVMGCVVNGPGESEHANIGISLPGAAEEPFASVYIDGKKSQPLKGNSIKKEFVSIIEKYIAKKFKKR